MQKHIDLSNQNFLQEEAIEHIGEKLSKSAVNSELLLI